MTGNGYHHGQVIRVAREQLGLSRTQLAEKWPGKAVSPQYVQRVEAGDKHITDPDTLRQLADLLHIPLWRFGLSLYNPFNPKALPGSGEYLVSETLDTIDGFISQAWDLRRAGLILEAEHFAQRTLALFEHFRSHLPPPLQLEDRFLRVYSLLQGTNGVMLIDARRYNEALKIFENMLETAKQLDDPAYIAMAEVNIGVELERARQVRDAINVLEHARDTSFDASKYIAALANSYLARAYASTHDNVRFERTVETALNLALKVKSYGDGTDAVFHSVSGVLAERSYGYLEIGKPEKTLAMKDEIMRQIKLDRNARLHTWILLDWARAHFMLNQIEASVEEARAFFQRSMELQSPHALHRAYRHLEDLENAGYADIQVVRDFREDLKDNNSSSSLGRTSHKI